MTRSRTRRIGGASGSMGGCASVGAGVVASVGAGATASPFALPAGDAASAVSFAGAGTGTGTGTSIFSSANFSGKSVPCIEPSRGTAASSARV
ncbi:hypothetical protein [Burkholderia sp. Ac-20353]|uniref:hypothetical protein n=1 Tax=Burkholderia sp. Ac-20353 TaxID=2703894 RepID=UPI00197C3E08|nr:hypothetical protein [Burkholderia sp. Ac-20353]MBN3788739.1 hypothetical protein [Burkholderia sp. Ac-20353]